MAVSYPPISYGALLYPGFCVLDIAGPLEALNTLARLDGHEGMTLSMISKTMDPVNPGGPDDRGMAFMSKQQWLPTHTFENVPKIDILMIPGGWGSLPPADITAEVDFVRKIYQGQGYSPLRYLFTICTGAVLAAQAGILDGHRATTNKAVWKQATKYGPKTYWVGKARWVVSGNIWTTSGVTAGTDGMLAWLAHIFDGDLAEHVANGMEFSRRKDASDDPFSQIYDVQDVPAANE